jgi:hypothetical protein
MNEFVLHVLMIWSLLSAMLILFYEKVVVERHMEHNMYTGRGRSYNKKKTRSVYIGLVVASGVVAIGVVYLLSLFS